MDTGGTGFDEPVRLRRLSLDDEAQVTAAQTELARDGFRFAFREDGEDWSAFVERTAAQERGVVPAGWVPTTFLVAVRGEEIVGRVSIRHELNDFLLRLGGHIGYGVRPGHRRRGYASSILRQALAVTDGLGVERVLVTCDDDNVGSARTIEGVGGVLEDVVADGEETPKRRYWIDRSAQVARLRGRS